MSLVAVALATSVAFAAVVGRASYQRGVAAARAEERRRVNEHTMWQTVPSADGGGTVDIEVYGGTMEEVHRAWRAVQALKDGGAAGGRH